MFAGKRILQVDLDPAETERLRGREFIEADVGAFCEALLACLASEPRGHGGPLDWLTQIADWREEWPAEGELVSRLAPGEVNPNAYLADVARMNPDAAAFVLDVGQHQMWAAQSLAPGVDQRILTSGGHGAMGWALPASIGACLASGKTGIVCIAGDGGFQLNLQELETVRREKLPLRIAVLDNGSHGMVRQFQSAYFGGRLTGTVEGYSAPDFEAVARAYGLHQTPWHLDRCPATVNVIPISLKADALPKLSFGGRLDDMEPKADDSPQSS